MMDLGKNHLVDKRLAEEAALEMEKYTTYVQKVDDILSDLQLPNSGMYQRPSEVHELENLVAAARNLAWALRRFPVFDMTCMTMMRKEKGLRVMTQDWSRNTNIEYLLDIWVPVFAMHSIHDAGRMIENWSPTNYDYRGWTLEERMRNENQQEIQSKVKNSAQITLIAQAPPIPSGIMKKVNLVSNRFQETNLIWEAQWSAYARVEDPLVVGRIGSVSFLLDQFDATKLERYVVGEFCKKPVA